MHYLDQANSQFNPLLLSSAQSREWNYFRVLWYAPRGRPRFPGAALRGDPIAGLDFLEKRPSALKTLVDKTIELFMVCLVPGL